MNTNIELRTYYSVYQHFKLQKVTLYQSLGTLIDNGLNYKLTASKQTLGIIVCKYIFDSYHKETLTRTTIVVVLQFNLQIHYLCNDYSNKGNC